MLHDLVLKDDRPEWREWAREQLATTQRDLLDCEEGDGLIVPSELLDPQTPAPEWIRIGPDPPLPDAPIPILEGEPNATGTEGRTTLRATKSPVQQVHWYDAP